MTVFNPAAPVDFVSVGPMVRNYAGAPAYSSGVPMAAARILAKGSWRIILITV